MDEEPQSTKKVHRSRYSLRRLLIATAMLAVAFSLIAATRHARSLALIPLVYSAIVAAWGLIGGAVALLLRGKLAMLITGPVCSLCAFVAMFADEIGMPQSWYEVLWRILTLAPP